MSRLGRNVVWNVTGQALLIVLGFAAVKLVNDRLGADALGILFFSATLGVVLSAGLELGLSATLVRQLSSRGASQPEYGARLVRMASLLAWGLALTSATTLVIAAPWIVAHWIHPASLAPGEAARVLCWVGVGTLLAFPRTIYVSVLRGFERMEFPNAVEAATLALQQGGIVVLIARGATLTSVAMWYTASLAAGIAAYVVICGRMFGARALVPGWSAEVARQNRDYAGHMASISLLAMVHLQADKLLVSRLLPLDAFGQYAFAASVVAKAGLLTAAVSQAAFPSFSALHAAGDRAALLAQYRRVHGLITVGLAPVFVAIPFFALPVFDCILGPESARRMLLPAGLLALGTWMNATLNAPYIMSLAMGRPEIAARQNVLALAAVLPVTWLLVAQWGLPGAGLSWVWYHVFYYSTGLRRLCHECLGVTPADWYRETFGVVAAVMASYGPPAIVLVWLVRPPFAAYLALFTVATLVFFLLTLSRDAAGLRRAVSRMLASLGQRFAGKVTG